MSAQMFEVEYVRNRKEVKEILTFAAANALAGYLKRVFRIEAKLRKV